MQHSSVQFHSSSSNPYIYNSGSDIYHYNNNNNTNTTTTTNNSNNIITSTNSNNSNNNNINTTSANVVTNPNTLTNTINNSNVTQSHSSRFQHSYNPTVDQSNQHQYSSAKYYDSTSSSVGTPSSSYSGSSTGSSESNFMFNQSQISNFDCLCCMPTNYTIDFPSPQTSSSYYNMHNFLPQTHQQQLKCETPPPLNANSSLSSSSLLNLDCSLTSSIGSRSPLASPINHSNYQMTTASTTSTKQINDNKNEHNCYANGNNSTGLGYIFFGNT